MAASQEILELSQKQNLSDSDLGKLEYLTMTGFYSIRKLLEAETKLSASTIEGRYKTTRYPLKPEHKNSGKYPDRIFNKGIDHFYDLEAPITPSSSLSYICNQFIHSYVFVFSFDTSKHVNGVFFSSERDKQQFCNHIGTDEVAKVLSLVGEDYPAQLLLVRNGSGDWKVHS